jgi:transcriptional antiterminator RfaH
MPYWTVAQIESQREKTAADFLKQSGFATYLPQLKLKRSNGQPQRIVPFFPGYLFVQIIERWYPVRWSVGVIRLLMTGDHPADVGDDIINAIRRREGRDGFVKIPKYGLQLGQSVHVVKGSFAGHLAVFDGMAGQDRSRILLELLGRKVLTVLPSQDIVALEPIARN